MQQGNKRNIQGKRPQGPGGTPPKGTPRGAASHNRAPRQAEQKRDALPVQKPITDEGELVKRPSKVRLFLRRLGVMLLIGIALAMTYVFLLMGEPNVDSDAAPRTALREEAITVPIAAVEAPGGAQLATMAATFGKPLLALYGEPLPLQKVTLYDTAFKGGYARRATLLYETEDGQAIKLESIRPTAAVTLLNHQDSSLYAGNIYSLAGMEAARMDSPNEVCIFAKSDEVVYAVSGPVAYFQEMSALIRQTTLLDPGTEER